MKSHRIHWVELNDGPGWREKFRPRLGMTRRLGPAASACANAPDPHRLGSPFFMPSSAPASPRRFHYAWIVAGVTFITLMAAAGGRAAPSVMLVPLGNEFQWSRATVSSIVALNIFLYGLIG